MIRVAYFKKENILLWIGLSLFLIYATYGHLWFGELSSYIALKGWSAIDFSNSVLFPEYFKRDYAGGAWSIGKSITPHIYPTVVSLFGVEPEQVIYVMVYFEMLVFSSGAMYLAKTIFHDVKPELLLAVSILLICSWIQFPNLARFGAPFYVGQFYGFADGLRLFAIALYLQRKYLSSAGCLMLGFVIHPLKTVFSGMFVFVLYCVDFFRKRVSIKESAGYFLALIFMLVWYKFRYSNDIGMPISDENFFKYSPAFNSHWYPGPLGIYSKSLSKYLVPFLASICMLYSLLLRVKIDKDVRDKLSLASFSIMLLTVVGLVVSEFEISQELVKMCLQRSSLLLLTITAIILICQTWKDFFDRNWIYFGLGAGVIASSFVSKDVWPVSIVILYSFLVLFSTPCKKNITAFLLVLFVLFETLLLVYTINGDYLPAKVWEAWKVYFIYTLFCTFVLGVMYKVSHTRRMLEKSYMPIVLFASILFLSFYWLDKFRVLKDDFVADGTAYRDVQLWSRNNTPVKSLFMVDPCRHYGWRDYSMRSSFGTFQEWLKTGWLYTGDSAWFEIGLERAKLFGVMPLIDEASGEVHPGKIYRAVCHVARKKFYEKDGAFLKNIAGKYDIDYIVASKKHALRYGGLPAMDVLYQNERYVVLSGQANK